MTILKHSIPLRHCHPHLNSISIMDSLRVLVSVLFFCFQDSIEKKERKKEEYCCLYNPLHSTTPFSSLSPLPTSLLPPTTNISYITFGQTGSWMRCSKLVDSLAGWRSLSYFMNLSLCRTAMSYANIT